MINVICVHTAMALVEPLTKIFAELMPEVNVRVLLQSLISSPEMARTCTS